MRNKIKNVFEAVDNKFYEQFEFHIRDTTVKRIIDYMYKPTDATSLAFTRIVFGVAMLLDIPEERGGATLKERWGNPITCHFPLFGPTRPVMLYRILLAYIGLWFGAIGIALGYAYRISCISFTIFYWYILLIEKSYWNNHSYLFGLIGFLLTFTQANCCWSIDAATRKSIASNTVPYWNYFILKYQFFILYFVAGIKKGTAEWLSGYSVLSLSEHWVFGPFKYFLTVPQTDYFVVHWFVFAFDLTIAFWMMWSRTRHYAMIFCALFHLMNSRLFSIGMFPWVCLFTLPLFYPFDWPKLVHKYFKDIYLTCTNNTCRVIKLFRERNTNVNNETEKPENNATKKSEDNSTKRPTENPIGKRQLEKGQVDYRPKIFTCFFIAVYVFLQAFLPFSHFITKGFNNWTDGLYGYSWDMMVHTWDTHSVVIKIVDSNQREHFINPYQLTPNDRWTRHGDMLYQFAQCLNNSLKAVFKSGDMYCERPDTKLVSLHFDVWTSLNGRFTQRMFDPKVNMLNASWSPFKPIPYLMPLLDEAIEWRSYIEETRGKLQKWNKDTEVVFIADFPGYEYEKFIPREFIDVTLKALQGTVVLELSPNQFDDGRSYLLKLQSLVHIIPGTFHKVRNIGDTPAYYMYTFVNATEAMNNSTGQVSERLPIVKELQKRAQNMYRFFKVLTETWSELFFTSCE